MLTKTVDGKTSLKDKRPTKKSNLDGKFKFIGKRPSKIKKLDGQT
ncbi:MAG: hypothetical protein RR495_02830 [Anaerovoracaceae bacterium]